MDYETAMDQGTEIGRALAKNTEPELERIAKAMERQAYAMEDIAASLRALQIAAIGSLGVSLAYKQEERTGNIMANFQKLASK